MEPSESYLVVERMIRAESVLLSELERLLDSLAEQGMITKPEQEALLELAWKLSKTKISIEKVKLED